MRAILAALLLTAWVPAASAAPAPAPARMIGFIASVEGSVQVQRDGIWSLAKAGQQLSPGAQIKTMSGGAAIVGFTDGSKLRVGPNATFKLEESTPSKIAVFIGLGRLEAWVSKMAKRTFQARNPVAVASVRGTIFAMDVLSPTSATMDVFQGALAVTDNFGRTTPISEGMRMEASATTGASAPAPLPAAVTPPVEPKVEVPPAIKQAAETPAEKPAAKPEEKAEEKKEEAKVEEKEAPEEVAAEEPPAPPAQPPAAPPNPSQETTTVSPSAP